MPGPDIQYFRVCKRGETTQKTGCTPVGQPTQKGGPQEVQSGYDPATKPGGFSPKSGKINQTLKEIYDQWDRVREDTVSQVGGSSNSARAAVMLATLKDMPLPEMDEDAMAPLVRWSIGKPIADVKLVRKIVEKEKNKQEQDKGGCCPACFRSYDGTYLQKISKRIQEQDDPEWYIQVAAQAIEEMKSVEAGLDLAEYVIKKTPKSPWREQFDYKELESLPSFSSLPGFTFITLGTSEGKPCGPGQNPERDKCIPAGKDKGEGKVEGDGEREKVEEAVENAKANIYSIKEDARQKGEKVNPDEMREAKDQLQKYESVLEKMDRGEEVQEGAEEEVDVKEKATVYDSKDGTQEEIEIDQKFWGENGELKDMPSPDEQLAAMKNRLEKDQISSLVNAVNASMDEPMSEEDMEWEGKKTSSRQELESDGLAGSKDAEQWARLRKVTAKYLKQKMPNYSDSKKEEAGWRKNKEGVWTQGEEKGSGSEEKDGPSVDSGEDTQKGKGDYEKRREAYTKSGKAREAYDQAREWGEPQAEKPEKKEQTGEKEKGSSKDPFKNKAYTNRATFKDVLSQYQENKKNNLPMDNVFLLTKNFGTPEESKMARQIIDIQKTYGGDSVTNEEMVWMKKTSDKYTKLFGNPKSAEKAFNKNKKNREKKPEKKSKKKTGRGGASRRSGAPRSVNVKLPSSKISDPRDVPGGKRDPGNAPKGQTVAAKTSARVQKEVSAFLDMFNNALRSGRSAESRGQS